MKIVKPVTYYLFSEVTFGGVFGYNDAIYMKMNPVYSSEDKIICNAVSLMSGRYELIDNGQEVIYYPNAILTFE